MGRHINKKPSAISRAICSMFPIFAAISMSMLPQNSPDQNAKGAVISFQFRLFYLHLADLINIFSGFFFDQKSYLGLIHIPVTF